MTGLTQCRLCTSPERIFLFRKEDLPVVRCGGCGIVYADRRLSDTERQSLYAYYAGEKNGAVHPLTERRYQTLLNSFSAYRVKGRLLEIGCGRGYFLETARKSGWEVTGTEFSGEACERVRSKGLDARQGTLSETGLPPGHFDVLVLLEVLEHMERPMEEMRHAFRLLRPGGLMYLTTPNFNGLTCQFLKGDWRAIHPEHRFYFTPKTLDRLLRQAGFRRRGLSSKNLSVGELWNRWVSGVRPDARRPSGRNADETFRQGLSRHASLRGLQKGANVFLRLAGWGDTLEARYEKPN